MSSRVPPELTDRIIDFLWHSRPDLCACSLVCCQWVPSTRRHLFESITVRPDVRFLTLLQSPSNVVANHTRTLDFRLWPADTSTGIPPILHHLPSLWRLGTMIIGSFPPSPQNLPVLSQVEKLSFQHTKFASCSGFTWFISKFTGLRELELGWITWANARDDVWPSLTLELESLSIQGLQNNPDVLPWLSCAEYAPRTRGLSLYIPNTATPAALAALSIFLHHLDGHLWYLKLDVYPVSHLQRT